MLNYAQSLNDLKYFNICSLGQSYDAVILVTMQVCMGVCVY